MPLQSNLDTKLMLKNLKGPSRQNPQRNNATYNKIFSSLKNIASFHEVEIHTTKARFEAPSDGIVAYSCCLPKLY